MSRRLPRMHSSQKIFSFLLPLKCFKMAISRSGSVPVCRRHRWQEQQLMKPVMRMTMRVSSHPDSKAITGSSKISPPIIPLTMQSMAITPEMCSPSYSIDDCYYYSFLNYMGQILGMRVIVLGGSKYLNHSTQPLNIYTRPWTKMVRPMPNMNTITTISHIFLLFDTTLSWPQHCSVERMFIIDLVCLLGSCYSVAISGSILFYVYILDYFFFRSLSSSSIYTYCKLAGVYGASSSLL